MDDDLKQLEAELKRLRPAAVRPGLLARLESDLGAARVPEAARRPARRLLPFSAAIPLAAAAALVLAVHLRQLQPEAAAAPAAPVLQPVHADDVLTGETDQGYVKLPDGTVAHQVRRTYVDTFTWKNPKSNASLTWSVPRSEVQVVPTTFE